MDICWACCTINTETSTHVPTKFRLPVALLYLNQCPLNSILSKCCHFLYNLINHYKMSIHHNLGFYTVEVFGQMNKRHNSITHSLFLEAGIKKPNMDANVDHTSLVQILDLPYESPKEQFMLLSSLSNFHKFGYPAMSELSSKSVISPSHITYCRTCTV